MSEVKIPSNEKERARLAIAGLQNVVNMGSQRLAYLEGVVAKGGADGLSLADATEQMNAMKERLAAHKAEIEKLQKEI